MRVVDARRGIPVTAASGFRRLRRVLSSWARPRPGVGRCPSSSIDLCDPDDAPSLPPPCSCCATGRTRTVLILLPHGCAACLMALTSFCWATGDCDRDAFRLARLRWPITLPARRPWQPCCWGVLGAPADARVHRFIGFKTYTPDSVFHTAAPNAGARRHAGAWRVGRSPPAATPTRPPSRSGRTTAGLTCC